MPGAALASGRERGRGSMTVSGAVHAFALEHGPAPVVGDARRGCGAILAAAIPLLYPAIPPLVDLLGHMGRYRVELDLSHSPWLSHYYGFQWAAIGNLGVDLLVMPLGRL